MNTRLRQIGWRIVLPCAIGLVWIVLRAATFGTPTSLLAIGADTHSYRFLHSEMPHAYIFEGNGFDGMSYYVIARSPTDPPKAAENLDYPTYRMRRILYPLLAKAMVPAGGPGLVYAFAALSLIGIAIGGWALGSFPGAPRWLPITMAVNPGVITSLFTSTSDTLAAGLVLVCFAAAFKRRFAWAIVFLALAGLTRETALLAVLPLALWPGLDMRRRVVHLIAPTIPVVAWSLYLARTLGESVFQQPGGGTFTIPPAGWLDAHTPLGQLVQAAFCAAIVIAAAVRSARRFPAMAVYLAATMALFVSATPVIVSSWLGFSRILIVALPVAMWVLTVPSTTLARFAPRGPVARRSQPVLRPA